MSGELDFNKLLSINQEEVKELVAPPSNQMYDDERLVLEAVEYYKRIIDDGIVSDSFIRQLESGIIRLNYKSVTNSSVASIVLVRCIELASGIKEDTISDKEPVTPVQDATSEWIKEVKAKVIIYADDILYDSVIMWCEAIEWDKKMCQPIIDMSSTFYQQISEISYPELCLMIKAANK